MITRRHLVVLFAVTLLVLVFRLRRGPPPSKGAERSGAGRVAATLDGPRPSATGDRTGRARPFKDPGGRDKQLQLSARRMQEAPPFCLIEGSTLTSEGEALAGARIALAKEKDTEGNLFDEARESVLSGSNGDFDLQLANPFQGWIEVSAPGFSRVLERVQLHQGGVWRKVFRLRPASSVLSGRVLDGITAAPVAGALVQATVLDETDPRILMTPRSVRSSRSGDFVVPGVPLGGVTLVAISEGYFEDERQFRLNQGSMSDIQLRLVMGDVYTVQVLSSRGEPVEKAFVERPDQWVVQTDAEGRVSMPLIAELSRVFFKVRAPGFQSAAFEFARDRLPQSVVLENAPVFSGQVVAGNGHPVEGAAVTFVGGKESVPALQGTAQTDRSGRFSKIVTDPPVRQVRVSKAGYLSERFDYGDEGAPTALTLPLRPAEAGLIGSVSNADGSAAERFHLSLTNLETGDAYNHVFGDTDGKFEVYDAPAGRYRLHAEASVNGYATYGDAVMEVVLERGQTAVLDVHLKTHSLPLGVPIPATWFSHFSRLSRVS